MGGCGREIGFASISDAITAITERGCASAGADAANVVDARVRVDILELICSAALGISRHATIANTLATSGAD